MVKVTLVPVIKEQDVQITMTMDIARSLKDILGKVGGSPLGYRGDSDEIYEALSRAGVSVIHRSRFDGAVNGFTRTV